MASYYDEKIKMMDLQDSLNEKNRRSTSSYIMASTYEPKKSIIEKVTAWFKKIGEAKKQKAEQEAEMKATLEELYHGPIGVSGCKTYTSYCGADCVVFLDGEALGELESLVWYKPTWHEERFLSQSDYYDKDMAAKKPIVIKAKATLFNKPQMKNFSEATIKIKFANEYGDSMERTIRKATVIREIGGISIDSVVLSSEFVIAAESMYDYVVKEAKGD